MVGVADVAAVAMAVATNAESLVILHGMYLVGEKRLGMCGLAAMHDAPNAQGVHQRWWGP